MPDSFQLLRYRARRDRARAAVLGLALLAAGALSGSSAAGASAWQPIGPEGGSVISLAIDPTRPDIAYAGSAGPLLWRTANGGRAWRLVTANYPVRRTESLAIDLNSRVLAAGVGGLVASVDGGQSWTSLNTGLPRFQGTVHAFGLALAPSDPRVLYVQAITVKGYARIFASRDGGASWYAAGGSIPYCGAGVLAVHPRQPSVVYFGCSTGVFVSRNGGQKWQATGGPLQGLAVVAIAADPARPKRLYAAVQPLWPPPYHFFWVSNDAGAHWKAGGDGLQEAEQFEQIIAIAPSPHSAGTVLVGDGIGRLLRSTDAGLTFQQSTGVPNSPHPWPYPGLLVADPRVSGRYWAGFAAAGYDGPGIFKSADSGRSWHSFASGMRGVGLQNLLAGEDGSNLLGRTFRGRLMKSANGGGAWQRSGEAIGNGIFHDVISDPIATGVFYGATDSGVYRSLDNGGGWAKWGDPALSPSSAQSLSVSALTPSDLYALNPDGLHYSHDSGETWKFSANNVPGPPAYKVIAAPSSPDIVYELTVACFRPCWDVLRRSADGGATWTGLSRVFPERFRVLVVDRDDPNRLYGASSVQSGASLVLLTEGGEARRDIPIADARGTVTALIQDGAAPPHLVVGTSVGEIWESTDAGDSWVKLAEDLGEPPTALALDPFSATRIYVATENGVFVVP